MDTDKERKKLNDDMVVYMRRRSETRPPRYTARLKTYVDFLRKCRRAQAARKRTDIVKKKNDEEPKAKETSESNQADKNEYLRRGYCWDSGHYNTGTDSSIGEPADCGCRRRRRRRRRRSCRRRRRRSRRRRSCRRRRRRRRRSCRRRRRRRSCRRRRRRSRRRRKGCGCR